MLARTSYQMPASSVRGAGQPEPSRLSRAIDTFSPTPCSCTSLNHIDRTVMLHEGGIVLDVQGEQRAGLDVPHLLDLFAQVRGEELSDDALLLG